MIEAFPLTYPPGKVRCKWPESSRFRTTLGASSMTCTIRSCLI